MAVQIWIREEQENNAPIHLIINRYHHPDFKRNKELQYCYLENRNNPLLTLTEVEGFPTFTELFSFTQDGAINIIANSDIFFDNTLSKVRTIKRWECYALTRWDWDGQYAKHFNRVDSQDVWIFRGKVRIQADFRQGQAGCDNRLAKIIKDAGYVVKNPSKQIHAIHFHTSQIRKWGAKVEGEYLMVNPE